MKRAEKKASVEVLFARLANNALPATQHSPIRRTSSRFVQHIGQKSTPPFPSQTRGGDRFAVLARAKEDTTV